jgi:hypothetical protein
MFNVPRLKRSSIGTMGLRRVLIIPPVWLVMERNLVRLGAAFNHLDEQEPEEIQNARSTAPATVANDYGLDCGGS